MVKALQLFASINDREAPIYGLLSLIGSIHRKNIKFRIKA
jgi:hypothetical protein